MIKEKVIKTGDFVCPSIKIQQKFSITNNYADGKEFWHDKFDKKNPQIQRHGQENNFKLIEKAVNQTALTPWMIALTIRKCTSRSMPKRSIFCKIYD